MTRHYYTHVANGKIHDTLSRIGQGGRTCTAAEALGDARYVLEEGATSVTIFRDLTPWIRLTDEASKHGEAVRAPTASHFVLPVPLALKEAPAAKAPAPRALSTSTSTSTQKD